MLKTDLLVCTQALHNNMFYYILFTKTILISECLFPHFFPSTLVVDIFLHLDRKQGVVNSVDST